MSGATVVPELPRFPVRGRRLVLGIGLCYVALTAGFPFLPIADDEPMALWAVLGVLVGGPGITLTYGGYRLPRTDIRPELYGTVARWCLRGIVVGLAVMVPIVLASSDSNVGPNALLLTALGSLAGFGAGLYDARAKTRELELQETIDQLQTSNERLEQFAHAASHDLQEPLRMVSSYLQLLESRYRDDLDQDAREYIDFAVGGADRMRAMIDDLLVYSQVSASGDPTEPTDADNVLDAVRADLRDEIEETDATITAEELPTVAADEEQLAQVFRQLLDNALTFCGDEPPYVSISAERDGDMWWFSITDEGIGVAPAYHEQIFEVFEKAHSGKQAPVDGSGGIGLALCERIVERHGGEIRLDSEPGEGATVSFSFPAADV